MVMEPKENAPNRINTPLPSDTDHADGAGASSINVARVFAKGQESWPPGTQRVKLVWISGEPFDADANDTAIAPQSVRPCRRAVTCRQNAGAGSRGFHHRASDAQQTAHIQYTKCD